MEVMGIERRRQEAGRCGDEQFASGPVVVGSKARRRRP